MFIRNTLIRSAFLLLCLGLATVCRSTETVLYPTQDLWVEIDGDGGDLGGQGPTLEVEPRANHRAYLQFSLGGLADRIRHATLALYHTGGSIIVQADQIQCRLTSNHWTESFTNGYTAPPPAAEPLATGTWISGSRWGVWSSELLTEALRSAAGPDARISLVLMDPRDNYTARRVFASKDHETSDFHPRLHLALNDAPFTPTRTPTPSPSPTATYHPLDLSRDGRITPDDLFLLNEEPISATDRLAFVLDFILYWKYKESP